MPKNIEGRVVARPGDRYAVVVSRTNSLVTQRLLDGCLDTLVRHGVPDEAIEVVWVPGSFELPVVLKAVCEGRRHAGAIALGCVIRGGTPHFDYIAAEVSKGAAQVALQSGLPVAFGVLTCDSLEQALERAGAKGGNKGAEAALSALDMADLLGKLRPA